MRPAVVFGALALVGASAAFAHEARPGYLELRERTPRAWEVLWKQPVQGEYKLRLAPVFPADCRPTGPGREETVPGAILTRVRVECERDLAGRAIAIAGLEATLTDVLVRVHRADGGEETQLAQPAASTVTIAGAGRSGAAVFFGVGLAHILEGFDHLLFVLGLLLIVKDRRVLLMTVTAFTLAHSLSLAAATLGWARVPVAPVEATIALSILFLGPEILRAQRGGTSLTLRHPWAVAFAFGLLHGFGFATGLSVMGLPQAEIPVALLAFNVGVEGGQLAFVAAVVLLARSLRGLRATWPPLVAAAPAYLVGSLGAYWTIERAWPLVAGAL